MPVSILIRLVALAWSLVLMRRLRDWRLAFLTVMPALMALRQTLTLKMSREVVDAVGDRVPVGFHLGQRPTEDLRRSFSPGVYFSGPRTPYRE